MSSLELWLGEGRKCIPLDDKCKCDQNKNCELCHGKGYILSENGKALMEFMKRHMFYYTQSEWRPLNRK